MRSKSLVLSLLVFALAACSSTDGPSGSLEVTIGNSPLTLPETGSADAALTLTNTGAATVIVDLCSEKIAAGIQERIDGVWVQAGSNSCGGSDRRSVEIGSSSSISSAYAISRPGTFRLQVPYRNSAGDFAETISPPFEAIR